MIYPWQNACWQQLNLARQSNRLTHALLFTGIKGLGKAHFAEVFSRALLCAAPKIDGFPCDECHSCVLHQGKSHPNMFWVMNDDPGHAIKVDHVRELTEFVQQSSFQKNYRIGIIDNANLLNTNAANALLKTLEEPAAGAMIILICHERSELPATIVSRCQQFHFQAPVDADAIAWLQSNIKKSAGNERLLLNLANGAPLLALELHDSKQLKLREDILKALLEVKSGRLNALHSAQSLKDIDPLFLLDTYLAWLTDLMRLAATDDKSLVTNLDYETDLLQISKAISQSLLAKLINDCMRSRRAICDGVNLNKQLLAEHLLIQWANAA